LRVGRPSYEGADGEMKVGGERGQGVANLQPTMSPRAKDELVEETHHIVVWLLRVAERNPASSDSQVTKLCDPSADQTKTLSSIFNIWNR
jgi:hypothetical protein